METQVYYVAKLKEVLSVRQKSNPEYSLRAFARDLDMYSATLSQILKGQRGLPLKKVSEVIKKLELSPQEKALFVESFYKSKTRIDEIQIGKIDQRFILDEAYFKIIAEWEHFAVLELFKIKSLKINLTNISNKLSITLNRAEVVLTNLINAGLVQIDENGRARKVHEEVKTTEDISSVALKRSHNETLEMAIKQLEKTKVELRDYSSSTLAIDMKKLPEAKAIIREFRQKMAALLNEGDKTDVYQLAIQFFPLTKGGK